MMPGIWYLASPHAHADPVVRRAREVLAARAAAQLMLEGVLVFSPIAHGAQIDQEGVAAIPYETWMELDLAVLGSDAVVGLIVLMLPGWETSVGVRREIKKAGERGIPTSYLEISHILAARNRLPAERKVA
jgi:hypothetical protein